MNPNEPPKNSYSYNGNESEAYDYTTAKKPEGEPKISRAKEHITTILILIAAPVLAVMITAFVFRTYQVDGPSMESTLQNNDRLIIDKIPVTLGKITGNRYVPGRYDIIVFKHKGQFGGTEVNEKQLIKRVIGLPGDRVVVQGGIVTIYNKEKPEGFMVDKFGPEAAVIDSTSGNIDETIKPGEIFVMGDNRGNSLDSRNLGTIRVEDIIGKLTFRIYPFQKWNSY
jgi:signal peptidase I